MVLHIKNMVCDRCIMVVEQQLAALGFTVTSIVLGQVSIAEEADENDLSRVRAAIKLLGFELIDEKRKQQVERIKNVIVEMVHHTDPQDIRVNYSDYISSRLERDYPYLSNLFSESEDITIEKYIINQKIEKVKELLEYDELNLNQIALQMGYSSTAHLSTQFKNVTGITPSKFKAMRSSNRKPLDMV
jgi:AraC family transcriptional regulator